MFMLTGFWLVWLVIAALVCCCFYQQKKIKRRPWRRGDLPFFHRALINSQEAQLDDPQSDNTTTQNPDHVQTAAVPASGTNRLQHQLPCTTQSQEFFKPIFDPGSHQSYVTSICGRVQEQIDYVHFVFHHHFAICIQTAYIKKLRSNI